MNNLNYIFKENLKYHLKKNNKTQRDLAKYLNVSNATVNFYVKGLNIPRLDKIEKICKFFNITKDELLNSVYNENNTTIEEEQPQPQKPKGVKIPVLGTVIAGLPVEAIEDIIDYEEIPAEWTKKGEFFGLQIKGDSMAPRIEEHDVVIVKKQNNADTGDIVIALINGDEATCKKLKKVNGGIMLISNNPLYEPLFFTEQDIISKPVTIIGKVVELRAKF